MKLIELFGDRVKTNELMSKHTTYRIGGPADFYLEAKSVEEVKTALAAAKEDKLPVFILGGGSNLLVSDDGVRGLVLVPALRKMTINPDRIYADAGAIASLFARLCSEGGLMGMEWSAGLPGTVGGALRGNAGAYGASYADIVKSVDVIDRRDDRVLKMENNQCAFAYRESLFKQDPSYFILGAEFALKPGADAKVLIARMNEITALRAKHPHEPSAGSIFKNHYFNAPEELSERIRAKIKPEYLEWKKIPAAWLIELLDLKGKKIGAAQISPTHANYVINTGGATASDVLQLISYVKMKVRDELGVQLNEEIEYVGF